jgi:hypothetical protein
MAVAEELQIIIDAKVTQAVKDLKKVDASLKGNEKSTGKLASAFKTLAGPLALGAVIAGSIRLGKEFSKAASDAEEIESKFRTVYRSIGSEAEDSAQRLADSFDLADSTAQQLLGTTGDLLTGLGFTQTEALGLSEQVNTLAIDLASFSNYAGGAEGASEALTKALLGESEMAKGLGIVINQNTKEYKDAIKFYTEVEGKTLLQAKAYTALQFATEQSGNAIGDYSRTSESAANVTRRLEQSTLELKEALGTAVNEGLTPMKAATATLVQSLADFIEKNNEINSFLATFDGKTIDASVAMDTLNDSLKLAEDRLKQATAAGRGHTETLEAEISTLKVAIAQRARGASLDAQYADAKAAQDKAEQDRIARQKAANDQQIIDLDALMSAFALTEQGQKQALETQIAYFESFKQGPMAEAVLEMLNEQLAKYNEIDEVVIQLHEDSEVMFGAMNYSIDENVVKVKELNETIADLATSGMGALARAFEASGQAGLSTWDVFKQAGKDAVAAVLKGLAEIALVEATADLIKFNFAGAALWTAAASGAYAAAGKVQSFATGGSFVANQATPIMVGEGGGSERVTIDPIGGSQGGSQSMILSIDGRQFTAWMQSNLDNGGLRVPRRVIV